MSGAAAVGRVHVLTDRTLQSRYSHGELAVLAARGGADLVQYREKRPMGRDECTMALASILRDMAGYGAGLIVDDRVLEARDSGAAGVHLGRGDMPPGDARRVLGRSALIGLTANNLQEALRGDREPVDYLGVGPVFGTLSKENAAPALGMTGLRKIVDAVALPVVAIGGIHAGNAAEVMAAGARGVAVLSAVVLADDPERATREIVRAVTGDVAGKERDED